MTNQEIIEAEVVDDGDVMADPTALALRPESPVLVAMPVSVEQAVGEFRDYLRLTQELLDDSDYQRIGNKRFKKKSAWRKYARAFNVSDAVTYEEIVRAEDGWPLYARIRVRATAPNGRTEESDQEAHLGERCCPAKIGLPCRQRTWSSHTCCTDACNPRQHWSHPGDIPATALTRAKNRAIADLIGAGEVSAEEMHDEGTEDAPNDRGRTPRPPEPRIEQNRPVVASEEQFAEFFAWGKNTHGLEPDVMVSMLGIASERFNLMTHEELQRASRAIESKLGHPPEAKEEV